MEGVFIGFNMLELREEYIKIGELWLNNDGDELYIKPHEASVYFHDIEKNQIHVINKSFNSFIENVLFLRMYSLFFCIVRLSCLYIMVMLKSIVIK